MRFADRYDNSKVLAEHGRWIASLRDDARVLEQRFRSLERRTSTLEANVAELGKVCGKLDLALAQLSDRVFRAIQRLDCLDGLTLKRARRRTATWTVNT